MLNEPFLAKCTDRSEPAKKHPNIGGPDDWLSLNKLMPLGVYPLSFDFFIDWPKIQLSREVWIKRIVDAEYCPWPLSNNHELQDELDRIDNKESLNILGSFCKEYNMQVRYFFFKESSNWGTNPSVIISAVLNSAGILVNPIQVELEEIMKEIKHLSGGPISIGSKGLIYGTSTLECYLSKTDALWPGDVDAVIVNKDKKPVAVLEYKKHTLSSQIQDQALSNYYPGRDQRKYDRIAILRNNLGGQSIPFIVIYYPTQTHIQHIKIEYITGSIGHLTSSDAILIDIAKLDKNEVSNKVINAIGLY